MVGIRFGQKFCPKRTLFFIRFGHWPKATFFFIRFGHWPKRKLFICYYFIRFGQSKIFFMVSAKSCYLCFSDKLINCTFRPKIIKYTFRPKFVSLFTSFLTRGREKAGVYSYWHCGSFLWIVWSAFCRIRVCTSWGGIYLKQNQTTRHTELGQKVLQHKFFVSWEDYDRDKPDSTYRVD